MKDELKAMRRKFGMSQTEFGEWLAREVNANQDPKLKPVSPYAKQRVHEWEDGDHPIPMKIENILMRRKIEQQEELIQKLKQRPKQK
jgi:hypothetical protein